MAYFLIQSTVSPNAVNFYPSQASIEGALATIPGKVGLPRITRQTAQYSVVATVTILIEQSNPTSRTIQNVVETVYRRLTDYATSGSSEFGPREGVFRETIWDVRAMPYDPATHGSVEWWRTGQASQTATRDRLPSPNIPTDNPSGPNIPPPPPAPPGGQRTGRGEGELLMLGLVGLLGLYYLGKDSQ